MDGDTQRKTSDASLSQEADAGAESVRDGVEPHADEETGRRADVTAAAEYEKLLDRLAALAQTFGNARDLAAIFVALRDFACASTPCNGIFVSLYDAERRERRAAYAFSEGEESDLSQLPPLPMTGSPHSRAVATGEVVVTDDYQAAMSGQPGVAVAFSRDPRPPRSSLAAPMVLTGRTLGAVELQSPELAAFRPEHVAGVRLAANLAAVAIENVRLLERELERVERAARGEKMRSLGQLAAGVAHDFNNALTVILGRAQLLARTAADERARQSLSIIETAALDAAETVRRIQNFARHGDDDAVAAPFKRFSAAKLLTDALQLTRTRWETDARARGIRYDIEFVNEFAGGVGDIVAANPSELREVFVNLVFNALDAMPGGGRVEVRERIEGGEVVVEISDTGHGVPAHLRERIFEPFFTTKGERGSGLGLAVSYGIVRRHHGDIEVVSEEGRGATFRLRFPLAREGAGDTDER